MHIFKIGAMSKVGSRTLTYRVNVVASRSYRPGRSPERRSVSRGSYDLYLIRIWLEMELTAEREWSAKRVPDRVE